MIKRHRSIIGLGLGVPHSDSYRIASTDLRGIAGELDLPAEDGPLILIAAQDRLDPRWLWRRTFHERLHVEFDARRLTPAQIRERLHRLGGAEFHEIRRILRQDHLLLPPGDEAEVYGEFAARFLELLHFEPEALDRFFPTVGHRRQEIEALLREDVNAVELLRLTRPPGFSEEPNPPRVTQIHDLPRPSGAADAGRAAEELARGNAAGAAIRSIGASGTAEFVQRLAKLAGDPGWEAALRPILAASGGDISSSEARLLYDLQAACLAIETTPQRVDLVEWLLSLGRRPIRRTLESTREVSALERVRRAARRLGAVRVPRAIREPLRTLLLRVEHDLEKRIRAKLRPLLDAGIAASGLRFECTVERAAGVKLADELVDRIVERGFFTFSELRDAVARNQAKLTDLSGPVELLFGDALLRMDRHFAAPLEGVYRRGEVYLRWLQRLSSLAFGTSVGRFVTKFAALPFGGAFVVLEGLQHMVGPLLAKAHVHVHLLTRWSFIAVGLLFLGLIHVPPLRRALGTMLRGAGKAVKALLVDLPFLVLTLPPILFVRRSKTWRWLRSFILAPALLAALLTLPFLLLRLERHVPWAIGAALFLAIGMLMNSPSGQAVRERGGDWLLYGWRQVSTALIPGIVLGIVDFFRATMNLIERGLYRVDEFLRFRPGDSAAGAVIKATAGLVWSILTYLLRLYLNLLVEPQVNPVKHFPVVTVSHKIMLPFVITLTKIARVPLMPLGDVIANAIAVITVFLLPGVFGFLVWELKENWRLYRASRPKILRPSVVGSHGETVARLLRPGFHSGTVPKLFAKLRRARRHERRVVVTLEASLHHVEESVRRFIERDGLALLHKTIPLEVEAVHLSPSRIGTELKGLTLTFEERDGRLVAGAADHGLIAGLTVEKRRALEAALAGLFHRAGADFTKAQLAALLGTTSYDVSEAGLVVWRDGAEVVHRFPEFNADDLYLGRHPIEWTAWVQAWEAETPPPLLGGYRVM